MDINLVNCLHFESCWIWIQQFPNHKSFFSTFIKENIIHMRRKHFYFIFHKLLVVLHFQFLFGFGTCISKFFKAIFNVFFLFSEIVICSYCFIYKTWWCNPSSWLMEWMELQWNEVKRKAPNGWERCKDAWGLKVQWRGKRFGQPSLGSLGLIGSLARDIWERMSI